MEMVNLKIENIRESLKQDLEKFVKSTASTVDVEQVLESIRPQLFNMF